MAIARASDILTEDDGGRTAYGQATEQDVDTYATQVLTWTREQIVRELGVLETKMEAMQALRAEIAEYEAQLAAIDAGLTKLQG